MAYGELSFQNQNYQNDQNAPLKSEDTQKPQQQQQQPKSEVVEDFLIKFVKDKAGSILPETNLKKYIVFILIGLFYLLAMVLFLNTQLQGRFVSFLPVYLQRISKFEYGTYFAVFLLLMTVMTGLYDYNFTYMAIVLTGAAFFYVSTTKTVCASIRWPLFTCSILMITFVLANKVLCFFENIKVYSFWYSYFSYLIILAIVLVILDFLIYIPARCQLPMNGSGDLFYSNKIV
jgi:hypothetical protein